MSPGIEGSVVLASAPTATIPSSVAASYRAVLAFAAALALTVIPAAGVSAVSSSATPDRPVATPGPPSSQPATQPGPAAFGA